MEPEDSIHVKNELDKDLLVVNIHGLGSSDYEQKYEVQS